MNYNYLKEVAAYIVLQLGGKRFIAMTGAKNMSYGKNGKNDPQLKIQVMKGKNNINSMIISLNNKDLYDIVFYSVKNCEVKEVSRYDDVYCDMLTDIFETETGLKTSL